METFEFVKNILAIIGAVCIVCAIGLTLLYFCFTSGIKEEIKNEEIKFSDIRNFN